MKLNWTLVRVVCVFFGCALATGCDGGAADGEDADSAIGTSLVQGSVQSFEATSNGARVLGAVGGASVRLEGATGRSATADDDGDFLLVAVPAGQYRLIIASGGVIATYESLTVGTGVLVRLGNINVGSDLTVTMAPQPATPVLTVDQPAADSTAAVDIEGTWVGAEGDGEMLALTLKEAGGSVSGIMANPDSDALVNGSISGTTLALIVDYQNGAIDDWRGTVDGNRMSGTWICNEGDSGTWSAVRQ